MAIGDKATFRKWFILLSVVRLYLNVNIFFCRTNSVHHNPGNKDVPPCLGAPPPLISPKGPHHPSAPPTTLWNPASLVDTPVDSRRKLNPPTPPSRPPPGLTRADRPPLSWGDKLEDGGRRKSEGTERYTSLRGASLQEAGSWTKTEQDRAIQSLYHRHHISSLQQRSCVPPDLVGQHQAASPSPVRERQSQPPDSMLVYDEVLQQHRRLLSKLDLEEKRRKEAREGGEYGGEKEGKGRRKPAARWFDEIISLLPGYYYDLDESYDESDEEEVKAHLRRVTEQPPLKLDTSSEVRDTLHRHTQSLKMFLSVIFTCPNLSHWRKWIFCECAVWPRWPIVMNFWHGRGERGGGWWESAASLRQLCAARERPLHLQHLQLP